MLKKIVIAGLVGTVAVASTFFAVPALAQGPGTGGGIRQGGPRGGGAEKHPALRRAMMQLTRIEGELGRANDDFQGHKEQARDLIRKAIDQLKMAIHSDKH